MRYIVYGAGAIGGVIGGRLASDGHDVVLIARGPHLDALRVGGLRLITPDGELHPQVTVAGSPAEAKPEHDDVVLLATKSQGTEGALAELERVAPGMTVICAQNGVDNERATARRGFNAYAMYLVLPATHLEPGVVVHHAAPVGGILDVGRYPAGEDVTSQRVAADLRAAGFESRSDPTVMRWKYTKLLGNLGNALEAACGRGSRRSDLYRRAHAEAEACYEAAGIDYVLHDEDNKRRGLMSPLQSAGGIDHRGGSSWQSLARSTGNVEADWLNGEIVLLGRLHGVPTPVNEVLRRLVNRMAYDRVPAGSVTIEEVEADVRRFDADEPTEGVEVDRLS
jgi:2-dehydropantoate 2-reductase